MTLLPQLPPTRRPRYLLPCAALAVVFTLLNAVKPLHIDDGAYYTNAAHLAADPLSPYGFDILWDGHSRPANELVLPPLLPYWWAAALRLFGEQPFLWKLWLLPFSLLLVFSLHALLRRFARRLEAPLLLLTVLSPSLLPGFNLMLDVPALALSLCAVALFLRAADRGGVRAAVLAGAVAGLAMQTKYTALVTPAVLLLAGVLFHRLRLGLAAAAAALLLFVGWEAFVALRHGQSHFLSNLAQQKQPLVEKLGPLFRALLNLAGGLAPATALLGIVGLGLPRQVVLAAGAAVLLGCAMVACVPDVDVSALVCRAFGVLLVATVAAAAWRLLRRRAAGFNPAVRSATAGINPAARRAEWFLVLWLVLELAGYFVLTPFPAARRVIAPLVVAALLVGRLAARTCRRAVGRTALVHAVAAAGVLLGLGFWAVDLREAVAEQRAAERAARRVRVAGGGTAWHAGAWGFRFYAERAGMHGVVLDGRPLRAGDWLVVPDAPHANPRLATAAAPLRLEERLTVSDALPLRTVWGYYGGTVPLQRGHGPRVAVNVYRVLADFVPTAQEP